MKMNKVTCGILLGIFIIAVVCISHLNYRSKEEFQQAKVEAQNLFVNEVIAEYEKELAELGYADIKVDWEFKDSSYDSYKQYVDLFYYSENIDGNYVANQDEVNSEILLKRLKAMYCVKPSKESYTFQIDERTFEFTCYYHLDSFFTVESENHVYELFYFDQESSSISVDNTTVYIENTLVETEPEEEQDVKVEYKPDENVESKPSDKTEKIIKNYKKYKNNPYDVFDYWDPDDFYYDNYDDFWEFEDAEDFFNDAWKAKDAWDNLLEDMDEDEKQEVLDALE